MPVDSTSRPNLFIVGAPKCGTNSLHTYLSSHPDVFMSERKEPRFYDSDLEIAPHYRIGDESRYLKLFEAGADCRYRGEASPLYLYSQAATRHIHRDSPDARIIIMLRHPVDMMISMHRQNYRVAVENMPDFADALSAEPDRLTGRRLPPGSAQPFSLFYRRLVDFFPHIKRYQDAFGSPNVHVMSLEQMAHDTRTAYTAVLRFLGVDDSIMPSTFDVRNPAGGTGGRSLYALWDRVPIVRWVGSALTTRGMRGWLRTAIASRWSGERVPPVDAELYQQLCDEYEPTIARLHREFGGVSPGEDSPPQAPAP